MNINVDRPMLRPALMVRAARLGAKSYIRERDLPGAVAGLLSKPEKEILPALAHRERQLEDMRRQARPGYRPAQHLQVLAALIAEARNAGVGPDEAERGAATRGSRRNAGADELVRRTRPAPPACAAG